MIESARWNSLHPVLAARLRKVFDAMAQSGHPMFLVEGVRSLDRQQQLYAQGRTVKGPKITNCDGIASKSNHQAHSDGFGYAADCAFIGPEPFAEEHPWHLFGAIAQDNQLVWGGNFKSLPDRPHVELPKDDPTILNA